MFGMVTGPTWLKELGLPTCPLSFFPQHRSVESVSRAHVCDHPEAIAVAPFAVGQTGLGELNCQPQPSPFCPSAPRPQHLMLPPLSSEQVLRRLAVMAVTPVRPD